MRIERLILDQVGCFEHLDLQFRAGRDPGKADIHLLVGANGTGKSTILMAMAQAFSWVPTGLEERFRGAESYVLLERTGGRWVGVGLSRRQSFPELTVPLDKPLRRLGAPEPFSFFEQHTAGESPIHCKHSANCRGNTCPFRPSTLEPFLITRLSLTAAHVRSMPFRWTGL